MSTICEDLLVRLGFSFQLGGAHLARSMMLADLRTLFERVPSPSAPKADFVRAVVSENCLGKRSARTRSITLRHLADLYGLDCSISLYRVMRHLWQRVEGARSGRGQDHRPAHGTARSQDGLVPGHSSQSSSE